MSVKISSVRFMIWMRLQNKISSSIAYVGCSGVQGGAIKTVLTLIMLGWRNKEEYIQIIELNNHVAHWP